MKTRLKNGRDCVRLSTATGSSRQEGPTYKLVKCRLLRACYSHSTLLPRTCRSTPLEAFPDNRVLTPGQWLPPQTATAIRGLRRQPRLIHQHTHAPTQATGTCTCTRSTAYTRPTFLLASPPCTIASTTAVTVSAHAAHAMVAAQLGSQQALLLAHRQPQK